MKAVINRDYGGFALSDECLAFIGVEDKYEVVRTDARLIAFIEQYGLSAASAHIARLGVVEIPDEATDWMVDEYDGLESLLYVLDGKLHWARCIELEDDDEDDED